MTEVNPGKHVTSLEDELRVSDQKHLDAWADTREGYTIQVRQAIVKCLWCDYYVVASTATQAVALYQKKHEQPIFDRNRQSS